MTDLASDNTGGGAGTGPGGGAGTGPVTNPPPAGPKKTCAPDEQVFAAAEDILAHLDLPARVSPSPTGVGAIATAREPGFSTPPMPPVPPFVAVRRRLAEFDVALRFEPARERVYGLATLPDGSPDYPGRPPGPPPPEPPSGLPWSRRAAWRMAHAPMSEPLDP